MSCFLAEEVQMSPVQDFNFYSVDEDADNEEDWEDKSGLSNDDDSVESTSSRLVKNALQNASMDPNDKNGI